MEWFSTDGVTAIRIAATTIGVFITTIVCVRINGLRTLSKMSSFDFAVTIAIGSLIAGTAMSGTPSLAEGIVAMAVLIACQRVVGILRSRYGFSAVVDNQPVLLMLGDELQSDAMSRARITKDDIIGKLREANVTHYDQIHAVVLESTGDISVLHGPAKETLDPRLLTGVADSGSQR